MSIINRVAIHKVPLLTTFFYGTVNTANWQVQNFKKLEFNAKSGWGNFVPHTKFHIVRIPIERIAFHRTKANVT